MTTEPRESSIEELIEQIGFEKREILFRSVQKTERLSRPSCPRVQLRTTVYASPMGGIFLKGETSYPSHPMRMGSENTVIKFEPVSISISKEMLERLEGEDEKRNVKREEREELYSM